MSVVKHAGLELLWVVRFVGELVKWRDIRVWNFPPLFCPPTVYRKKLDGQSKLCLTYQKLTVENETNGTGVSLKELSHLLPNKCRTYTAYGMMASGIARDILARDGLFCSSRLLKESMVLMSRYVVEPMVLRHRLNAGDKAIKQPFVVFLGLLRLIASNATHMRLFRIMRLLAD